MCTRVGHCRAGVLFTEKQGKNRAANTRQHHAQSLVHIGRNLLGEKKIPFFSLENKNRPYETTTLPVASIILKPGGDVFRCAHRAARDVLRRPR